MELNEYRLFKKFIDRIGNKKHKEILALSFYDGLRVKEIANKLNVKLVLINAVLRKYIKKFNCRM